MQLVANGVVGNSVYSQDSDRHEAMGYVRKSSVTHKPKDGKQDA